MQRLKIEVEPAPADVRLPKIFTDNMVLQQAMDSPVWGTAEPGEAITVAVAGQTAKATADSTGAWMVNNSYEQASAEQALADGADLVAFGKLYIANPDLVERFRTQAPLNEPDRKTFYGGGAQGYIDYPLMK